MTTAVLTRPTDLERAIGDLTDLTKRQPSGDFANGLLCSITVLTRVRDGLEPLAGVDDLDYAMIAMNGFAPE